MKKLFLLLTIFVLFLSFEVSANAKEVFVNNSVLDLRSLTSSSSNEGWNWDNDKAILTLDNYNASLNEEYGIDLPDKDVTIILKGTNNITCESNSKVRAIVIGEGSLTIKGNGTLNIKMKTNSDSAIGIATIKGKTNIEAKNININIINTNENGVTNGIYSSDSVSINNGNYNIIINGIKSVRSIISGNELIINKVNFKTNVKSNNEAAVSLMSVNGDTTINDSNLSIVLDSYEVSGGIWAYYDLKINNSKLDIKSTSNIDYNSTSNSLSLKNDMESRVANAYGIWAENNTNILNSSINITSKAIGASTSGIGCFNSLEIKNSNIFIKTNNETAKYDYGVGYAKKIIIDNTDMNINSKESAIFSLDNIELLKSTIQDNGIVMSTADNSKQTIGLKDAVITATKYNVKGSLDKVVIKKESVEKKSISLWIIGLLLIVVVVIFLAFKIIKKRKENNHLKCKQ